VNYQHLEAVCKGATLRTAKYGDQRLLTEGHIAFALADEFTVGDTKEFPKLADLWRKALAVEVKPAKIGMCFGEGRQIARSVGNVWIAERFIRCFGLFATWTLFDGMVAVHNGVLLGVVMPIKPVMGEPACGDITDADVFGPWACEENGWYLVDAKAIRNLLEEAEDSLDTAQEKLNEAESEVAEAEREVDSLRDRLEVLAAGARAKELRSQN